MILDTGCLVPADIQHPASGIQDLSLSDKALLKEMAGFFFEQMMRPAFGSFTGLLGAVFVHTAGPQLEDSREENRW